MMNQGQLILELAIVLRRFLLKGPRTFHLKSDPSGQWRQMAQKVPKRSSDRSKGQAAEEVLFECLSKILHLCAPSLEKLRVQHLTLAPLLLPVGVLVTLAIFSFVAAESFCLLRLKNIPGEETHVRCRRSRQ